MGQWLTPSRPSLVAVDLFLLAEWFRSSHELRLNVRENGPDGPLLASTTKEIRGPLLPSHRLLTHFDLESPLQVVAGKPLFVELINPLELTGSPDVHRQGAVTWSFAPTDAYQRGDSLWCYFPGFRPPGVPGEDFHFITYSEGDGSDHVCPQIKDRVPELAILRALAEPTNVSGYNELERPGVYPGPYNRLRTWLSIQRLSTPFHPVANRLVYRAGCP